MGFEGISTKKVVAFIVTCYFVNYSACHFPRLVREELHDHKRLTSISCHLNSFSKAILPIYPTLNVRFTLYDVCTEDYTPTATDIALLVLSTVRTMKLDWKMMCDLVCPPRLLGLSCWMQLGENLAKAGRPPPLRMKTLWQQTHPQKAWPHKGRILMMGKFCCHNPMLPSEGELAVGQVEQQDQGPRDGNLKAMAIASREHTKGLNYVHLLGQDF